MESILTTEQYINTIVSLVVFGCVLALGVILLTRFVRSLAGAAGSQSTALYFLLPMMGLFFFLFSDTGVFMMFSSKSTVFHFLGVAALAYTVVDERRISKQLYGMRVGSQTMISEHTSKNIQYSTDMHRAAGANSANFVKRLTCPNCGGHCVLPMGHAIACAYCGKTISFAAASVVEASALANGSVLTGENLDQEKLSALQRPHSVEDRPIWGDTTMVKFVCPRCGKPSVGFANQSRQCQQCGTELTTADIVTTRSEATE